MQIYAFLNPAHITRLKIGTFDHSKKTRVETIASCTILTLHHKL